MAKKETWWRVEGYGSATSKSPSSFSGVLRVFDQDNPPGPMVTIENGVVTDIMMGTPKLPSLIDMINEQESQDRDSRGRPKR